MHRGTALEPGLGGERGQVSALGVLLIPFIKDPVSRAQGESLTSGGICPVLSPCRALSVLHLLHTQRNSVTHLRSDHQELAN